MGKLQDKVAVITGAGQGMGEASADLFASEGARVIAVDINDVALAAVRARLTDRCDAKIVDVSDADAVQTLMDDVVARFGRIDILVNAAAQIGSGSGTLLHELAVDTWQKTLSVNLTGTFLTMRAAIPHMLRQGGGSIVNYGSIGSFIVGSRTAAYVSTKGGVLQLTKAAAIDYARSGIRANCICPGVVASPRHNAVPAGQIEAISGFIPMGRMGTAEELARLTLFLASDEASFCTGGAYVADGGHMAGVVNY